MFHGKLFMTNKNYRIFERLRVAVLLTFISGYIDAYTYHTQGGRFAAAQTGNVIFLGISLAEKNMERALAYLIPIFMFSFGQWFNYLVRGYLSRHSIRWHAFSSMMMLSLLVFIILLTPLLPPIFTISSLSFFASMQVNTFKRLRGMPYANVMMTGNIKNAAHLLVKGLVEKNKAYQKEAFLTYSVIVSFIIGIILSSLVTAYLEEHSLIFLLFPVGLVSYWLYCEDVK
ncbi:DUF1275 domain-containing protein [Streptococcus ovuberis]|uniref:DUF1275 domain-containing protein n=2 Tax=Streptococcus ovuberis TaxID=1936207 RepID=A0A7X6S1W8_9STRE|nr:DUF1275 domain-containing protein [Streptococcus ovuberis]